MRRFIKKISLYFAPFLFSYLYFGCGENEVSTSDTLIYYLEKPGTNVGENTVIFKNISSDFIFKFEGNGLDSPDIAMGTFVPIREETKLIYAEYGTYNLDIYISQADGTPYHHAKLSWDFSNKTPNNPIVSFSEDATNDINVELQISTARGFNVNEVWIEGDLAEEDSPEGSWKEIPITNSVPLKISSEDGLKSFKVKLRNIYGNISEEREISISKKSVAPTDCQVELLSTITADGIAKVYISAKNDGPLYFRAMGDVKEIIKFKKFLNKTEAEFELSQGEGEKKLLIQVRDEAENFCDRFEYNITVDPDYSDMSINTKENVSWTDDRLVTLNIHKDKFTSLPVQMKLFGHIDEEDHTHKWIDYQTEIDVNLQLTRGHRFVYVQFRDHKNKESNVIEVPIYLKPFIDLQGNSPPYTILLSNLPNLEKINISGCQENHDGVEYQTGLLCTPNGSKIEATYFISGEEAITRSKIFP